MPETARVRNVVEVYLGSQASAAAALGAVYVYLYDVSWANADGGLAYHGATGTIFEYAGRDDANSRLVLGGGVADGSHPVSLPIAIATDDEVLAYPLSPERWAYAAVAGAEGEAVVVRVEDKFLDRLPLGPRNEEAPETVESILVTYDGEDYRLDDVVGRVPVVDGSYLDTYSLPAVLQPLFGAVVAGPARVVVDAISIKDGAIGAKQIAAVVALASLFVAAVDPTNPNVGQRLEVGLGSDGSFGLRWYDSNGNLVTNFPVSGDAAIGGIVSALQLAVSQSASFSGDVTLSAGTPDPTTAPTLSRSYAQTSLGTFGGDHRSGLHYDASGYNPAGGTQATFLLCEVDSTNVRALREYRASDGALLRTYTFASGGFTSELPISVTRVGASLWVLYQNSGGTFVLRQLRQSDLTVQNSYDTGFSAIAGTYAWAVATDGTFVYVANTLGGSGTQEIYLQAFLTGSGVKVGANFDSGVAVASIQSNPIVDFTLVSSSWYFLIDFAGSPSVRVTSNVGVRNNAADWAPSGKGGITHDGTYFWIGASTTAAVRKNTNWLSDASNANVYARVAWIDGSGHESARSPVATMTNAAVARGRLHVTVPAIPTGATGFRVYVARGNTEPALASYVHAADRTTGSQGADVDVASPNTFPVALDGLTPLSVSTFPLGTPARLIAGTGTPTVILRGDGLWDATDFQPKSGNTITGSVAGGIPPGPAVAGDGWDYPGTFPPYSVLSAAVPSVTFGGTPINSVNVSGVSAVSKHSRGFAFRMSITASAAAVRYVNTYSFVAP